MLGTLRTYDVPTRELVKQRIKEISEKVAQAHECDADVVIWEKYPPIINHATETNHVIRLAKKFIGEEHFS